MLAIKTLRSANSVRVAHVIGMLLAASILANCGAQPGLVAAQDDPAEVAARLAEVRETSASQMKQIMIAMHNYHDKEKSFPAAYCSRDGKPQLSWRVALLPFMEDPAASELHREFRMQEPWDSQHNQALIAKMPQVYQSPASQLHDGRTVYLTPRGDTTVFPGQRSVNLRQIRDGTSSTIALIEVDDTHAVPLTKPDDWKFNAGQPKLGLGKQLKGGFQVAMCDGAIRFVSNQVDSDLLVGLFTMAQGEVIVLPK